MTERDVLIAACGVDEMGGAKSVLTIETKFVNVAEGSERIVDEITLDGPVLNLHRNLKFMIADITFDDPLSYEIVRTVALLQDFTKPQNSIDVENTNEIPVLQFTFAPKELGCQYFGTGLHGSWVLIPSDVGKQADTIRFIFDTSEFHTYRVNEEAVEKEMDNI